MITSHDNTVPYLMSYHSLKAKYKKKTHYVCSVIIFWLSGSLDITEI